MSTSISRIPQDAYRTYLFSGFFGEKPASLELWERQTSGFRLTKWIVVRLEGRTYG